MPGCRAYHASICGIECEKSVLEPRVWCTHLVFEAMLDIWIRRAVDWPCGICQPSQEQHQEAAELA